MDIYEAKKSFDKYTTVYQNIIDEFSKNKKEVLYPIANDVLQRYSINLCLIFESMFESANNENLYTCSILYRSFIEHHFRAFYILEKTISDKNEEVSINFKKHYLISEFLAEKAGVLDMEDLRNGNLIKTKFLDFISATIPELNGFTKEDQQKISAVTKQFGLKEIIKHFHQIVENKKFSIKNVIAEMIPEYSRFSTFTHGGMYANSIMDRYESKDSLHEEIARIIEITVISICVINEGIILMYKPDQDVTNAIVKLKNVRI